MNTDRAAREKDEKDRQGLCADCVFAQRIGSSKGSIFLLCRLSKTDPRFPKYPRLPVLACAGYRPVPEAPPARGQG